jgi:hypothetical protein
MTKETLYIEFIEHLIEDMENSKLLDLKKDVSSARLELLSEFYNLSTSQKKPEQYNDLLDELKRKIEVMNVIMIKANTWS